MLSLAAVAALPASREAPPPPASPSANGIPTPVGELSWDNNATTVTTWDGAEADDWNNASTILEDAAVDWNASSTAGWMMDLLNTVANSTAVTADGWSTSSPAGDEAQEAQAVMVADEPWEDGDDPQDFAHVVFANRGKPGKDAILLLRETLRGGDPAVDGADHANHGLQAMDRTADPAGPAAALSPAALEDGAEPLVVDAHQVHASLGHLDDEDHVNVTGNGSLHGWPMKLAAVVEGDLVLGGLMMVHERHDRISCGPIMPQVSLQIPPLSYTHNLLFFKNMFAVIFQGGIQALEAMLYSLDRINGDPRILPGIKLGAHILDDCDKDTHGLEMAVDFIKGQHQCACQGQPAGQPNACRL